MSEELWEKFFEFLILKQETQGVSTITLHSALFILHFLSPRFGTFAPKVHKKHCKKLLFCHFMSNKVNKKLWTNCRICVNMNLRHVIT